MSNVPRELRDEIPSFDAKAAGGHGPIDWTGLTSIRTAKSALEIGSIVGMAMSFSLAASIYPAWRGFVG